MRLRLHREHRSQAGVCPHRDLQGQLCAHTAPLEELEFPTWMKVQNSPSLVSALPPTHLPGRKQGNPLNFPSFNALPSISLLPFLPFPKGRQECSSLLTKTHLQEQSGDSEQSEHHWRCKNHPALRLNPLVCYPLRKHNIFIWKSDFLSQNELISLEQNIESKIQKVCRKKNALMWNIIGLVKNRTACFQRRQEKTEGEMEEM